MLKKLLLYFSIFCTFYSFSQDDRKNILGKIIADSIPVKNVHIFNLNSRKGTISNTYGEFRIPVKLNDTLFISDIQYESQKIQIDTNHLNKIQLIINLKLKINQLNVVNIKEHELTGNLVNDAENTALIDMPFDMGSLNIDMNVLDNFDEIDREKAPDSRKLTDPTEQAAQGNILGLLSILGIKSLLNEASKIGQKKRHKKREQKKYEKNASLAPSQIRSELGDSFFVNTLKIPAKNIDNFIDYCKPTGIIDKYLTNNKLKTIDILIEQSKLYLKELKDEN